MARITRVFALAGTSAVLMLITVAASVISPQRGTGQEWVSWSPEQRGTFIDGFVTGYVMGARRACDVTNDLFEVGKMQRLGKDPSARCSARLELYSKDLQSYTTVLTDFYTQHPNYQNIPVVYLMRFLSDSQFKTSDELYQMALKGELRTIF
jgi:hypothetical protein